MIPSDTLAENIRRAVLEQFRTAEAEFGFRFTSPYCLDAKSGLSVFGYLCKENPERGRVIELMYCETSGAAKWCAAHQIPFSVLSPEPLLGEYDRSYFEELLDDWKYDL